MIKHVLLLSMLCSAGLAMAQDISGKWRTIDDETKKPKAIVQISKSGDSYSGRIISLESGVENKCAGCSGAVTSVYRPWAAPKLGSGFSKQMQK
jgi:hypothetical protein